MLKQQQYLIVLLLMLPVAHTRGMDAVLGELKRTTQEKQTQQVAVAATSQPKEEQKKQELTVTFATPSEFISRIQLCDKKILEQTVSLQPLVTQQKSLDSKQITLGMQLAELLKKRKPVQDGMRKLTSEKRTLVNQEENINLTKQAAHRLLDIFVVERTLHEPLLEHATKQQLTPCLVLELETQKKELATKIKTISAQWKELNTQLNPLEEQEKAVGAMLDKNKAALSELLQAIDAVHTAKADAELEKTALFKAIDGKIASTLEEKQKLEDEVKAIRATIAEETDTKQKIALRTELATKERTIGEHQQTISEHKLARAQADGTYSKLAWIAGKYN